MQDPGAWVCPSAGDGFPLSRSYVSGCFCDIGFARHRVWRGGSMKTSVQIAATAILIGVAVLLSGNGHAQQTSDVTGPISKAVADGYAFSGGTSLGPEQGKSIVAPNKVSYEVKFRVGYAY